MQKVNMSTKLSYAAVPKISIGGGHGDVTPAIDDLLEGESMASPDQKSVDPHIVFLKSNNSPFMVPSTVPYMSQFCLSFAAL